MPGLLSGKGADRAGPGRSARTCPARAGSGRADEPMPTTIDAAMPLAVVRFQNSSMTMAGRLAEAATAKAQPTRKDTFMPLNRMPSTMAIAPTTKAAILPASTFCLSVDLHAEEAVHQVVGHGARGRDDQAADRAQHRGEGDGRDDGEQAARRRTSPAAAPTCCCRPGSTTPLIMAPRPMNSVRM